MTPNIPTSFDGLLNQLYTILIFLERPIVQLQVGTLVAIVVLGWFCSHLLSLGIQRYTNQFNDERRPTYTGRLLIVADTMSLAIITLTMMQAALWYMTVNRMPVGLLTSARPLFLLILAYEFLVGLLYWRYEPAVIRVYHYRVLLPLFLGIVGVLVLDNIVNLRLLAEIQLFELFSVSLTVGLVIRALIIIYIFGTAAYLIQNALERVMTSSGQNTAATTSVLIISRYVVLGIGILVFASALGVDTSTLTVIGGGLSIGIGFGLQQIVANFISGILLLFEQSLRPGDVIDINGQLGVVDKLNIRSTSILTNDNVEIIVPNEQFLTNSVTSYTRNSQLVRVSIPFGVSYKSDPKAIRDLVLETVKKHGLVKNNPSPQVQFLGFGDSSLDFRALVWIDQPRQLPRFRSDMYFMIWEAFARHKIEIPFPQQDLHLRSGWEVLRPSASAEQQEEQLPEK